MGSFQNEWDFLTENSNGKSYVNNRDTNNHGLGSKNYQQQNKSFNDYSIFEKGSGGFKSNSFSNVHPLNDDFNGGSSMSSSSNYTTTTTTTTTNSSTLNTNINTPNTDNSNGPITHILTRQDTLQGLAIKYGVKIDDIKRLNKIYSNDTLFLKKSLTIPKAETNNSNSNNSSDNESNNMNGNGNSSSPNRSMNRSISNGQLLDHNNMFPEFERMNKSFGTPPNKLPPLPEYKSFPNNNPNIDSSNWRSIPVSTFSTSPVVTALDKKTQSQFSLLDETFYDL
ncbi:hypothetical protein DLAC_01126 [Tieghemostelium lacteum]|uniref:LysM domain-containing protein n=1 Tax=Tieghemostelium lacteum TaxID=361077 RepID=A0A152A843_TIELA|nr:hypothetical protein DLAC_01126 [Tieghemostelium lacteum]|eukprot:KYR02295.1 hypothetical protein DLAC_01126 [Tieghemostelium lacteum]